MTLDPQEWSALALPSVLQYWVIGTQTYIAYIIYTLSVMFIVSDLRIWSALASPYVLQERMIRTSRESFSMNSQFFKGEFLCQVVTSVVSNLIGSTSACLPLFFNAFCML